MFDVIGKKVLVFVAHQDDEVIGCGGTIAKWSSQGAKVHVCFLTDGATGIKQQSGYGSNITTLRMAEASEAAKILGATISTLGIPCQEIRNDKKTFHSIIQRIRSNRPDIVITHSNVCKHRDHIATSEIVAEACWKSYEDILEECGKPFRVKVLLECEVLDTFQNPDYIVDVTDFYHQKMQAMKVYTTQMGVVPGIEEYLNGITLVRGYNIGPGLRAEAFNKLGKLPLIS